MYISRVDAEWSRAEPCRARDVCDVVIVVVEFFFGGDLASRDRASMFRPRRKFSEGVMNQQGALCFFQDAETCEQ